MSLHFQPLLHGVLPVFQMPYRLDESIDYGVLGSEIDWLFASGADGVVMGMVSETLRLSTEERRKVAVQVCKRARERGAVVISVGAESSRVAVDLARHAEDSGATGVMAIPPLAVALSDAELRNYYRLLIASVKVPLIVQDAGGYVGKPLSITMQAALLDEFGPERVYFKPETPPLVARLAELRVATRQQAVVFEGGGGAALAEAYALGVAGTMPGADLAGAIVPLWNALKRGDAGKVSRIQVPLVRLVALATSLDAYLAIEKLLLVRQGVFKNTLVRGPVGYRLDVEIQRQAETWFDELMNQAAA